MNKKPKTWCIFEFPRNWLRRVTFRVWHQTAASLEHSSISVLFIPITTVKVKIKTCFYVYLISKLRISQQWKETLFGRVFLPTDKHNLLRKPSQTIASFNLLPIKLLFIFIVVSICLQVLFSSSVTMRATYSRVFMQWPTEKHNLLRKQPQKLRQSLNLLHIILNLYYLCCVYF